jgi:hypothetical protein
MKKRIQKSKYKPLLFTTTVRNPGRMKGLLNIFCKFNGEILNDELAEKVMGEIIRYGLYRPTRGVTEIIEGKWGSKKISEKSSIGIKLLTDEEVIGLLNKNPQNHQEAGFKKGWSSRFATVFDFAKELGFVYYWPEEKIRFSEIGSKLAESVEIRLEEGYILFSDSHPEFEQQAFLNALAKAQRNNPFVKVLNENVPLVLLLQVIQKLNLDKDLNNTGISKLELPLVIYWKDGDAEKLYLRIKKLRHDFGSTPSWEVVSEICINEIMEGRDSKRKAKSIMSEYPDEFIRKMRLTGLISLRGAGRFIDINKNESGKVKYVLENYSKYKKYNTEKEYFEYVSSIDNNLISLQSELVTLLEKSKFLEKWVSVYSWGTIKSEMLNLSKRHLTKDEILKYLPNPVRLEFLTTLAVKSKFPNMKVIPNYPVDDEGIPTSTAGGVGNTGDIECYENSNGILIEVTMSEGRTQTMMEVWPISRHLQEFKKKSENSMCYFVAPSIFIDSLKQIQYVKQTEDLSIYPKTIEEFLKYIENKETLHFV